MTSLLQSSDTSLHRTAQGAVAGTLLAILLAGCAKDDGWLQHRRYAMGTWVDAIHPTLEGELAVRIERDLDALLGGYEIDYYAWADGELGKLNAAIAAGATFEASHELADLLRRAQILSRRSSGYFDPGVGAAVQAWGFHDAHSQPKEPSAEFLDDWTANRVGIGDLKIDGNKVSSDDTGLIIDLGGIAKGEVVDRLLERFAAAGVDNVLVDAGGDVRVLGRHGERSWSIGIQSPRHAAELIGSIELYDGEAAFTSGDYERFFDTEDGRRHHLLDPISGLPATHTQAVTVIARNGALADAAATAIFVAGPLNWREIANSLEIQYVLRVDAAGTIEMTPAMRERVRMQADLEPATMHEQP
jgi:thiamine biosynthesis lipoprotein